MTQERWKPVVGYKGTYEVSDMGRVRRACDSPETGHLKGKIMRTSLMGGRAGGCYPGLTLSQHGERRTHVVHKLVAAAFIGPCPEGYEVDHIDGVKTNNARTNLEYVTCRVNIHRSKARGVKHCGVGEGHGHATITEDDVREIRRLHALYGMKRGVQRRIANEVGLSEFHVSKILRGKLWAHVK